MASESITTWHASDHCLASCQSYRSGKLILTHFSGEPLGAHTNGRRLTMVDLFCCTGRSPDRCRRLVNATMFDRYGDADVDGYSFSWISKTWLNRRGWPALYCDNTYSSNGLCGILITLTPHRDVGGGRLQRFERYHRN